MEKLVDLLNKYERSKGTNLEITNWKCVYGNLSYFGYGNGYSEFLCISKRYGFIEWLVDNDKIDRDKCYFIKSLPNIKRNTYEDSKCDRLLMLLSIQDNPIEFLISILKDKKVRTVYVDEDGNVSGDTKRYSYC